jgi:hypothetical protein
MAAWYSLWPFGIFFQVWYVWTKKNLATLDVFPASKSYAFKTGKSSAQALSVNRPRSGLVSQRRRSCKLLLIADVKVVDPFQPHRKNQNQQDGVQILVKNKQKMRKFSTVVERWR